MSEKLRGLWRDDIKKMMSNELYGYAISIIPLFITFARLRGFELVNTNDSFYPATKEEIEQIQQELLDELLKDNTDE